MVSKRFKYQKITNQIIKKSFPILRKRKIKVVYIPMLKKYSGGALYPLPIIFLSRRTDSFSKTALTGLLVHELCHLELFRARGFFKNLWIGLKYNLGIKERRLEEDNTIKLAVKKGYAKEHCEITKLSENIFGSRLHKYYMSTKEIKQYAQKIGKW